MHDDDDLVPADSLGAGLVFDEDFNVSVILMIGNDGEVDTAISMSLETVEHLIDSMGKMINEAHLIYEALLTMPEESAQEYIKNWAARQRSELN